MKKFFTTAALLSVLLGSAQKIVQISNWSSKYKIVIGSMHTMPTSVGANYPWFDCVVVNENSITLDSSNTYWEMSNKASLTKFPFWADSATSNAPIINNYRRIDSSGWTGTYTGQQIYTPFGPTQKFRRVQYYVYDPSGTCIYVGWVGDPADFEGLATDFYEDTQNKFGAYYEAVTVGTETDYTVYFMDI